MDIIHLIEMKNPPFGMPAPTETMENLTPSQLLPLIFDIDVFQEMQSETNACTTWDNFEKLREFKNEIFFNSLTDKAKELFK